MFDVTMCEGIEGCPLCLRCRRRIDRESGWGWFLAPRAYQERVDDTDLVEIEWKCPDYWRVHE